MIDEPVQKTCWGVTLWAALALLILGALANVATADNRTVGAPASAEAS